MAGEEDFAVLLVLAEIGMALGHGSTSAPNAYLYAIDLHEAAGTPRWLLTILKYVCAAFIGLGVYLSGAEITKKIGTKFVSYTCSAAFAAQFSAMIIILISSLLGLPISTTQTFFFGLLGIGYFNQEPAVVRLETKLRFQLYLWWLLTIPVAILAPYLLSFFLANVARDH